MSTPTIEASDSTLDPQDLGGQGPPLMADVRGKIPHLHRSSLTFWKA